MGPEATRYSLLVDFTTVINAQQILQQLIALGAILIKRKKQI